MKKSVKKLLQNRNVVFGIFIGFFVVTLLPLVYIGRYNVMSADDYAMGKETVKIWWETHSFPAMFQYACAYMWKVYQTWQGCYTINFLDCFNPGFFGERWTWITPVIMLTAIMCFGYICCRNVLTAFFEGCKKEILVFWGILVFLIVQTMPSPVEELYWFSGAVAYTFLHFFMFFVISGLFKPMKAVGTVFLCIGMFWVGGSQYITGLECLLISIFLLLLQYKHIHVKRIVPVIFLLIGFLFNLLAPGNQVRQSAAGGMPPVRAIFESFVEALDYGRKWISPLLVVSILFLLPVIWRILDTKKKEYPYKYPAIVSLISFCIFAASFTPSLYGVGNVDAGRIRNLIQTMFYVFVMVNLFYWLGWLKNKMKNSAREEFRDLNSIINIVRKYAVSYQWLALGLIVLVFVGTGDKDTFAGMSAARSLLKGEARTYYAEAQERLAAYRDEEITVVEVRPFSVRPKVLFFNDVQPEGSADYWINENIAEYYEKEKVVLTEE